jgi:serine/threonine protein phosphatase PrpC
MYSAQLVERSISKANRNVQSAEQTENKQNSEMRMKMQVLTAYHTDVGIEKQTNQDSLCIQVAETSLGTAIMAVVCDGMGGLSKGELASANVIRAFKKWFDEELAQELTESAVEDIQYRWDRIIKEQNQRIGAYGRDQHISIGTTLTVLLIIGSAFWLIGHVGDSRAYRITDKVEQLTEDQTVVHLEITKGKLTPEEAETDPRRNVLLQCIGASKSVEPVFISGKANDDDVYLLCSDGFRHQISEDEIYVAFKPESLVDEAIMEKRIVALTETNKQRDEKDNITAILIKL